MAGTAAEDHDRHRHTITSANPTTSATKASTTAATNATTTSKTSSGDTTCSGPTIVSDAYSATVPKGWECSAQSGTLMITDTKFDTLMVMTIPSSTDAAKVCSSLSGAGTLTELPHTQWGGKTVKRADISSGSTKMHVRCVSAGGSVTTSWQSRSRVRTPTSSRALTH